MRNMLIALCFSMFLTAAPAWSGAIPFTAAHGAPTETALHLGWVKFKEVLEAETNGAIQVDIFPNQQMGGDREYTEAVQLGNLTAGSPSSSPLAGFAREFYALDVPFIFTNREDVYAKLDGEAGQLLLDSLEKYNMKGLVYYENGFRNLTANKQILSPDDLKGLKLRVMENRIHLLTWSTLGANPTPLAFGELFTALQQGTVDAQENPYELIYNNKFFEVQRYLMETFHIYTPYVVFMNLNAYNSFTPAQQEAIMKAAVVSRDLQRKLAVEIEAKSKAEIGKVREIVVLTPEQLQVFSSRLGVVHTEAVKLSGSQAIMDALLKQ